MGNYCACALSRPPPNSSSEPARIIQRDWNATDQEECSLWERDWANSPPIGPPPELSIRGAGGKDRSFGGMGCRVETWRACEELETRAHVFTYLPTFTRVGMFFSHDFPWEKGWTARSLRRSVIYQECKEGVSTLDSLLPKIFCCWSVSVFFSPWHSMD